MTGKTKKLQEKTQTKKRVVKKKKTSLVKKSQVKKRRVKKKKTSVVKKPQLVKVASKGLDHQISDLKEEIKSKDTIIREYQKQLSFSNEVVLKLTQEIQKDLQNLYNLHENLIPTHFPNIPDCEFSYKFISSLKGIGKDFYQIIPLFRRHFGLVMSSCRSHILSSLLFSSRLRLMARIEYRKLQPAEVLKALMKEVGEQMKGTQNQSQVDIFYGIVNQKTYQLSYCSIGQICCLLYSFVNNEIHELKPCAQKFSMEDFHEVCNKKMALNQKDHLIICSPGLIECKNNKGEIYGVDRLKEVVQSCRSPGAHKMRNKIMHSIHSFSDKNTKNLSRDQSIVVMEIKDRILRLA